MEHRTRIGGRIAGVGDGGHAAIRPGRAPVFGDKRGKLTLVPSEIVPFEIARSYVLSELPAGARRAGHACRTQHRFLVGISGVAMVTVDDGRASERARFTSGDTIHVPPGTWLEIEAQDDRVVVLVFADGDYDPSDYIPDRAELSRSMASSTAASASDMTLI
jgi:hypothetical protein